MEDEYNVATRYRTVRKHLDSLGYKQALTLDALPLIEKLLADLVQTTESLKHFKSIAQDNIEAQVRLQSAIDPYKCDNVRLVQECNQLHSDLLKERESHQKQVKDLKKEIHKLERECNDLQLVSSRNLHRIKELEIESSKKSKRILELQGKCLKPTISNVGLASKKRPVFPLRRPVIESEPLPRTGTKTPLSNLSSVEPKVVDLLNMADHKLSCLTHEVTKLNGDLSLQIDNVQTLQSQLTAKEKEIMRLKNMLEGGRPYAAVVKDCACKRADFMTSSHDVHTEQLKILQQEKLELEQQLKEALNKQHDAMTQALKLADRNEELEKELKDIDHIALAVEADRDSAVKENNRRVLKLQEKLENVMARVHVLENELTAERRGVQELRADLETCKLEKLNIQRNLESALDEKKQITNRINELTVMEQNLNDEIEKLMKENEKQKQDIFHLQYNNKLLTEQLNLKEMYESNGSSLKDTKEKKEYNKGQNGMQKLNDTGYNRILKQLDEKETKINDLYQAVEQLRGERDFYKNEYNRVKDCQTSGKDHIDSWSRIRELKCELNEKDNALEQLQREKKELSREKTNLEARLRGSKAEHKPPCRPCNVCKPAGICNCSPSSSKDGSRMKNVIERLESERDIARADVQRLIEERDALRERLKIAAEAHTDEQRRLRENLTSAESRLKQIDKERQELLLTQGARRATINGLEDQVQDLREELRRTKQELGTQRTQYFQLRALQDQTDQALGDAQNQLTQTESELNKALDRNRALERQQLQLENQVKDLQQEINNFKGNMAHLDHEKDQLLMMLDEKTERIATMEREMMLKEQRVAGSEQQIRELQHKNDVCVDQNVELERQLRSMQLEMENLERQLQTSSYDRENAIQENRRIQDDLAAATCEVRNLQRELEASRAESYDLKRQLQTYVSEVRRVEELLNRKENERTEMLNHFRSLSLEATVLENNNHSLESEAAEARGALQSAKDRLSDLERQLADKDSLIRGYETQISELTQNVASMETQLRQQGEQRHRTEADLTAVRDLCMKLDQQKDSLMQQLDSKDTIKAQYEMQMAKLKAEQAVIQDQMSKDRATIERLEMLLDQARQESMTVQANNQELQNEMTRMRQKVSELQEKLSSESSKLRQYQTQAAEYCKQISELRRQVTNERFDRARKDEESRRPSEDSPDPLPQTPLPKNQVPNERDTKCRSLNSTPDSFNVDLNVSDACRERAGGQTERDGSRITGSRSRIWNPDDNCRCNRARDVPCIKIILRSDCKVHSNNYDYFTQKETAPTFQDNRGVVTIEHFKTVNVSRTDSFTTEKRVGIENRPNCYASHSRGIQSGDRQSEDLYRSQGRHDNTFVLTTCSNRTGESIKTCSCAVRRSFLSNLKQSKAFDNDVTDTNKKADTNIREFVECPVKCFNDPVKFRENREAHGFQPSLRKSLTFPNVPTFNSTLGNPVNIKLKPTTTLPDPVNAFPRRTDFSSRNEFLFTSTPRRLDTFHDSADTNKILTVCTNKISDIDKNNYERWRAKTNRNLLETEGIDRTVDASNMDVSKVAESSNARFKQPIHMLQDISTLTTSDVDRNLTATDQFKHTVCTNNMDDINKNNYERWRARTNRNLLETEGTERTVYANNMDVSKVDNKKYEIAESSKVGFKKPIHMFQDICTLTTSDVDRNLIATDQFKHTVCTNKMDDINKNNYERWRAKTNRNLLETEGIDRTVYANNMDISKVDNKKYEVAESSNARFKQPIHMFQDISTPTTSDVNRNLTATDQFKHTVCTNKMVDSKSDRGKHKLVEDSVSDSYMYKIDKLGHLGTLAAPDTNRNPITPSKNAVRINKIDDYKSGDKQDKKEEKSIGLFEETLGTNRNPIESKYEGTVCTNRIDKVNRTRRFHHEKRKIGEICVRETNESMNVFNDTRTLTTPNVNDNLTENIGYSKGLRNVHETRETLLANNVINTRYCTNPICEMNKCSIRQQTERPASSTKSTYCASTKMRKEFHTCECENKCIRTIDSALDILQSILHEVKRNRDQSAVNYQLETVKRKNKDRKDRRELSELKPDVSHPMDVLRPEAMKVLKEIKKHTETLEEHLLIMSKSMKIRRKGNDKTARFQSDSVRQHQKKDIITQNPEKKNIFVQEACPDFRKVENNIESLKNDAVPQREIDKKIEKDTEVDESGKEIGEKSTKHENYSKEEVKDVQIQNEKPAESSLPTGNLLDLPIATSTPIKRTRTKIDYSVCCGSSYAQTVVSKENLRVTQVERITSNELATYCTNKRNKAVNVDGKKKNIFVQEACPDFRKVENNFESLKDDAVPQREIDKKIEKDTEVDESGIEIGEKSMKHENYSKEEVKDVQIQNEKPAESSLPTGGLLDLPIATSTSIKRTRAKIDYSVCCGSSYAQTVVSKENLRVTQVEKITSNELATYCTNKRSKAVNVDGKEEISDEASVVIFLVAKTVNSRCLKSKCKRSEFLNFRPRRAIDSSVVCDQKLVKCRLLSRRKREIPVVFRLSSVKSKTDSESEEVDDERLTNTRNVKCSCNTSDLGNTVWTQLSSSRITAATSGPHVEADPIEGNVPRRREGCILS